jgi:TldD protein
MKKITRRDFIKSGASAAATLAVPAILTKGWPAFGQAESAGYFERDFGITDRLCRKILTEALAKGGDLADLFFEHTISNYLILEDGKVNRAFSDVALGVGIRTVKGDQVGYGFTQELAEKSMLAAAATAATIAAGAAKGPAREFTRVKTADYYPLKTLFSAVPLETKLPLVQAVNDRCFALSPLVIKVNAQFHDQQKRSQ